MAFSEELLAQKSKLEQEILALESSLGNARNISDLSSDSNEDSEDSGHEEGDAGHKNLEAERQQIQREIEELEQKLGADAALINALTDSEDGSLLDSNVEESDEDLDLPEDLETCLQMNLVYQEVLKEKLADLERLLKENREQQKDIEEQLSGSSSTYAGLPHLRLFLGNFMKPYFKDKLTGLGPPANEETKERMANGTKPCDERTIKRWEPWQKTLLIKSVATDTMKRMLQPKLSKMEYLTTKMSKAGEAEKQEIQNQLTVLEQELAEIRSLREDQLYGDRHDYHDWDKIANTDFECFRQPDDLMRFWQNYLHPSINKSTWSQDEISKLAGIAEKHMNCHWEQIAESLGTNRTAFMCFQTYQRYISKRFRKREWNKTEDEQLRELVDKMRIGNFIPYTQISYFMEGRDNSQLIYRWTCVLDPSLKKGPWTKEEDELLLNAVKKYGCKEWWKIKMDVPGRTDNACRDRYLDCLQADVKRGPWSDDEVELLEKLVEKHGVGKWSKIAAEMPNRVDSQCLNKWKWMQRVGVKRKPVKRARSDSINGEPEKKKRYIRKRSENRVKTESSEDEGDKLPNTDSDCHQPEEDCPVEDCTLENLQPDMKKWIPVQEDKLGHSSGKLRTTLVRLPTEAEEDGKGCVQNTVLDRLGNPVRSYVGIKPPALQYPNLSSDHAMIMVSECDVKNLLNYMKASVIQVRSSRICLASRTNRNVAENDQKEKKSETKRGPRKYKALAAKKRSYDLMLAVAPYVGNVIMHLPSKKSGREADVVQQRAAGVPLSKSQVFLLFLQALKVDADGCKNVIQAGKNSKSSVPGRGLRLSSDRKLPRGSYRYVKTQENIAEQNQKQSGALRLLYPKPAKIPGLPLLTGHQRKIKPASEKSSSWKAVKPASQKDVQGIQFASQNLNVAQVFSQTLVVTQPKTDQGGTPNNVVAQDASTPPQPVLHLAVPVKTEMAVQPAACPTTPAPTADPPTETVADMRASKRKPKPTMKAQALLDNRKSKLSEQQATKKQENRSAIQAVTVLPRTKTWILSPAGLVPVAEIQIQSPGIHVNQILAVPNNVQVTLQQPVIVNQSSCAQPRNLASDLPGNDLKSLPAESNHGQNHSLSHVSENHKDSSLPSSSNCSSVISAPVPQVLPDSNGPLCNTGPVAQDPHPQGHQNQTATSMGPMPSLVSGSSNPVGTSEGTAPSCSSNAAIKVLSDSLVPALTSTPCNSPAHLLNNSGPVTVPGPKRQTSANIVPRVVLQQPYTVNQNGSLVLIGTAGPAIPKDPLSTTASTNAAINNSTPTSTTESSARPSASLSNPQSGLVNSPVRESVGSLPTDAPINIKTTSGQIVPQEMQTLPKAATTSNPSPKKVSFEPSLMFFEEPAQVKNWLKGTDGVTLPGLKETMPYLPPFVSSIDTLTTLLSGKDSLLKSAVCLLPEEQREQNEEEADIAAVRNLVSETFKNNKAYLLLKARFLSCFTLPALLATTNQVTWAGEDRNLDDVDQLDSLASLFDVEERE